MKTIKLIETLIERAQRKGKAVNRKKLTHGWGMWSSVDTHPTEVYRIEYDETYEIVKLYHYGTKTCEIHVSDNLVTHIYGESISDVNSIFTFINYWLGYYISIGYKPVNGGFYLIADNKEIFYDDVDQKDFLNLINS